MTNNQQVSRHSCAMVAVVLGLHALLGWVLARSVAARSLEPEMQSVLYATLYSTSTPERASMRLAPLVATMVLTRTSLDPIASLPAIPIVLFDAPNREAGASAPQLLESALPDPRPFARSAGLRAGESVVVVVRIEVLATGAVGQVAVDASSGSDTVDTAALNYARQLIWDPGRVGQSATAVWVRYGVCLAA